MSSVTGHLPANPSFVFEVMSDARALRYVVVGARSVRRFDPRWPEAGTAVDHEIGLGPFVVRDRTVVACSIAGHRLLLEAHVGPLGVFTIDFRLEEEGDGSRVTVEEHSISGPFTAPQWTWLIDLAMSLRNRELVRRLRRLAERRELQRLAEEHHG